MNHQDHPERDELRARFTAWLETTVYRARLKYLEQQRRQVKTISLEDVPEGALVSSDTTLQEDSLQTAFEFEEERLARAFANLSIKRQQILTMLFVEERKPEEIAKLLGCSAQYVYNQRYQALKKIQQDLEQEETKHE